MKRKHEQSIIDNFFDYLKRVYEDKNEFYSSSLDGQDTLLNADYIFTNSTKFVLSEFKYQEQDIKSEHNKQRSTLLCLKLLADNLNKQRHNKCHFIAWSDMTYDDCQILLNQYNNEVCISNIKDRICIEDFSEDFYENKIGLEFDEFNEYIKWLLDSPNLPNDGTNIELIINDSEKKQFKMETFNTLEKLKNWLDSNKKQKKDKERKSSPRRRQ